MRKETRRRFFILSVVVFIVFGSGAVMYARGWRIDFSTLKPVKVGAVFIRSFPSDAKIYLNNRQVESRSSWLFQSGVFINNLPPKIYKLTLFSPGYKDWQSNIKILPSLVTEVKYAVLVPIKEDIVLLEKIKNFWFVDETLIFQDIENNIRYDYNETIAGSQVVDFSDAGEILTFDEKNKTYFLTNLKNKKNVNLNSALKKINPAFAKNVEKVLLDKTDGTPIIQKKNELYLLDFSRNKLVLLASSTASNAIQWGDASQFWLGWVEIDKKNNSSRIVAYDKFLKVKNISDETIAGEIKKMEWFSGNKIAVLKENGELFFYDILSKVFTKVADDVSDFKFNNNQTMIAAKESRNLEIFSLKNNDYWKIPLEEAKEIKNIIWYKDNRHLFVEYPNKIVFLDIDKNYQKEPTEVVAGSLSKYDANLNRLYFLKDDKLWKIDFPE